MYELYVPAAHTQPMTQYRTSQKQFLRQDVGIRPVDKTSDYLIGLA